jgi:hypothetical protein
MQSHTDMVIEKRQLTGNRTPAYYNVGKHTTNWTMADNVNFLLLRDLWSNSAEGGK